MLVNRAGMAGKSMVTFILATMLFGRKIKIVFLKKWHSLAGKHGTALGWSIVTLPSLGRELCKVWFGQKSQEKCKKSSQSAELRRMVVFCSRKTKTLCIIVEILKNLMFFKKQTL